MKRLLIVLIYLNLSLSILSQNRSDDRAFKPLIISTDFLSPVSIGVEKFLSEEFSIKARYHYLILFNQITSSHRLSNENYIADIKYYPFACKNEIANPYVSIYAKQFNRKINSYDSSYTFSRTTAGINFGVVSVARTDNGTYTGEINLGLGQRLSAYSSDEGPKLALRFNMGIGIAIN